MSNFVNKLEKKAFAHRAKVLVTLGLITVVMLWFGLQLKLEAGFEKQLPVGHEYIETFQEYRSELFGANRITISVQAREGEIWTPDGLQRLYEVSEALAALPGVNRTAMTSLWSPSVYFIEITEDGFSGVPLTDGNIVPDRLTPEIVSRVRERATKGGYIGTLISRDHSSASITAELIDTDPKTGEPLDYIAFNQLLEDQIRAKFENGDFEVQMIGFAKQIGDIAAHLKTTIMFFVLAFFMTALAVFIYCRSIKLTLLPLGCSLVSLIWQFGTLQLLGYGLDPLAILVPFLVFAIGVSHGVQQINYIVREVAHGHPCLVAAQSSFSGLFVPGTLALITTFVSFVTLILIPIPMIKELAIIAAIGVVYKIATNLLMLPIVASYCTFPPEYATKAMLTRERRSEWLRSLARVATPNRAPVITIIGVLLLAVALWQSQGRHIGSLEPGAPELRADDRYNLDAKDIVSRFDVGLDWLTIVVTAPKDSCGNLDLLQVIDDLGWTMYQLPVVVAVDSAATVGKIQTMSLNEGNPKMAAMPRFSKGVSAVVAGMPKTGGVRNSDCSVMALNVYLADHKATTIKATIDAVKEFRSNNQVKDISILLASGNAGVQAATNEVIEESEVPMLLYVYTTIMILVLVTYRDWRAVLACCLPLTIATWIGYWFMKELNIGLTVATLPVMVLAVGIGVDYAFYIYNRFQLHLANALSVTKSLEMAIMETGVATIFTAITLSIGVASWSFSPLKFQADMGQLLAFMFMVNMVMAIVLLPAFAAVLSRMFPRRGKIHVPGSANH